MTRKQMADQVQSYLGLQDISVYDETQFVKDLIYRGTIDLLSRTRCIVRCVHLHYVEGTDTYVLDQNILGLVDVDDGATPKARRDQSSWNGSFTMIRSDILRLNPAPSEDGDLDVWAVLRPQQMANDADSVSLEQFGAIPEDFQDAIVTYALWKASDYADDQSGSYGERYRILYEGQDGNSGRLAEIRRLVNKRGTARGAPRKHSLSRLTPKESWVG